MKLDDRLYQTFLMSLQEIERFRATHLELYKDTPLEVDDPNVKRMIEALAFYGAQARLQSVNKMTQMHSCLFRQYFPFLLNPLPSATMMQIEPSLKCPEKVTLPAGEEFLLTSKENPKATFQSLEPVSILPLFLKKFTFEENLNLGWRCQITYRMPHPMSEKIGDFPLYINHLSSFFSSLRTFFALQRSLDSISVSYDGGEAKECRARFGYRGDRKVLHHPIEQVRMLLHFPQQELFMTLQTPPAEKKWQEVTIRLNLNQKWPSTLKISKETLVPFATPIVNLKTEYSDPISCDGTKEGYPLLYPEPSLKYRLHTVFHVAKILPTGSQTLKPGILGRDEETYEVDYTTKCLLLNIPKSFQEPKTITVKALWAQPWFADAINEEHTIHTSAAQIQNGDLYLLSKIFPYEENQEDDPNFLLRIFSLKNQNNFTLNELLFVLNASKRFDSSLFDIVPDLIKEMKTHHRSKDNNTGSLMEYEFFLKEWGGQKWELVVLFFVYLHRFLNAWLSHFEIETKVHFPRAKQPLLIKGGTQNELAILARDFSLS